MARRYDLRPAERMSRDNVVTIDDRNGDAVTNRQRVLTTTDMLIKQQ